MLLPRRSCPAFARAGTSAAISTRVRAGAGRLVAIGPGAGAAFDVASHVMTYKNWARHGEPQVFSAKMAGDPMPIGSLPERRRLALATRKLRDGAPGVKMAAGWWVDGAGNFARQSDALPLHFWIRNRNRRQQRFGVGV